MKTRVLAALSLLMILGLTGCENDAASLEIDGKDHSISLIREQRWFWRDEVEQTFVPARLPECQRRYPILPGKKAFVKIDIYEVQPMLYLANQGKDWYVIGTEKCQVQPYKDTVPSPPGRALGSFVRKDGQLSFQPAK